VSERLEKLIEERGIQVDPNLHDDLAETVRERASDIAKEYPPDSFARIFWDHQQQALERKDSRSMRWAPAMIRFVLSFSLVLHGNIFWY